MPRSRRGSKESASSKRGSRASKSSTTKAAAACDRRRSRSPLAPASQSKEGFWSDVRRRAASGHFVGPGDQSFLDMKKAYGISSRTHKDESQCSFVLSPSETVKKSRPDAYWVMSRDVKYALTKYFNETSQSPNMAQQKAVLRALHQVDDSITIEKVTRWFQNRRAYVKRTATSR